MKTQSRERAEPQVPSDTAAAVAEVRRRSGLAPISLSETQESAVAVEAEVERNSKFTEHPLRGRAPRVRVETQEQERARAEEEEPQF